MFRSRYGWGGTVAQHEAPRGSSRTHVPAEPRGRSEPSLSPAGAGGQELRERRRLCGEAGKCRHGLSRGGPVRFCFLVQCQEVALSCCTPADGITLCFSPFGNRAV